MKNFFSRLRLRHWAWAHFLAVAGIWWPGFILVSPPDFLLTSVDPTVLQVCMWIAMFGSVLKIIGFLSSQQVGSVGVIGVSIELVGLILAAVGPVSYLAAYVYVMFDPSHTLTFGSAFIFAYAICAVYFFRAIIIVPRFRQEAHDPTKE